MHSTGELGTDIVEQALIVETPRGLVVVTGCAHPGIDVVAEQAIRQHRARIHLLMGGFHLMGRSPHDVRAVIARLQRAGVLKVAPSHCTGEAAIELFREAWGDDFVDGGLGAVIAMEP
jgi:7,8-dihydropterin-6-yl-methyl-4-(beta-D-ribofuranosyl)aminobenzene 5'-phosphate synthase